MFSFALAEASEFGFVLFSFAIQNQVLPPELANVMVVVVALSMLMAPLLMIIYEKWVQPRFATRGQKREMDQIDEQNAVIIAGFGRFGNVVGRLLKAQGIGTTVLDLDPDQIETLRQFGLKVFYGDAGRLDLLHSAGAEHARVLLLAIDNPEKATMIAEEVQRSFPHLQVLARADSLQHAYDLMDLGVDHVFRETFDSALSMGVEALKVLGFRSYEAHRVARQFKHHEKETHEKMVSLRADREAYMAGTRERMTQLEDLMRTDERDYSGQRDHAWDKVRRPDE